MCTACSNPMKEGNMYRTSCTACSSLNMTRKRDFEKVKKRKHIFQGWQMSMSDISRGYFHGVLVYKFREAPKITKLNIMITEKSGSFIRSQLSRTCPFENTTYPNKNYVVCKITRYINRRSRNAVYGIKCIRVLVKACTWRIMERHLEVLPRD